MGYDAAVKRSDVFRNEPKQKVLFCFVSNTQLFLHIYDAIRSKMYL